jgi:hypothetical protein
MARSFPFDEKAITDITDAYFCVGKTSIPLLELKSRMYAWPYPDIARDCSLGEKHNE